VYVQAGQGNQRLVEVAFRWREINSRLVLVAKSDVDFDMEAFLATCCCVARVAVVKNLAGTLLARLDRLTCEQSVKCEWTGLLLITIAVAMQRQWLV